VRSSANGDIRKKTKERNHNVSRLPGALTGCGAGSAQALDPFAKAAALEVQGESNG